MNSNNSTWGGHDPRHFQGLCGNVMCVRLHVGGMGTKENRMGICVKSVSVSLEEIISGSEVISVFLFFE